MLKDKFVHVLLYTSSKNYIRLFIVSLLRVIKSSFYLYGERLPMLEHDWIQLLLDFSESVQQLVLATLVISQAQNKAFEIQERRQRGMKPLNATRHPLGLLRGCLLSSYGGFLGMLSSLSRKSEHKRLGRERTHKYIVYQVVVGVSVHICRDSSRIISCQILHALYTFTMKRIEGCLLKNHARRMHASISIASFQIFLSLFIAN